jgi:hypothetical protein
MISGRYASAPRGEWSSVNGPHRSRRLNPLTWLWLRTPAAVAVSWAALSAAACTTTMSGDPDALPGAGGTGNATTGGSGGTTSVGGSAATGNTTGGGAGSATTGGGSSVGGTGGGTGGSTTGGSGGSAVTGPLSTGGSMLRLLTQSEYLASLKSLFGTVTTPLDLPADTSAGGYIALGASRVAVNSTAADKYETASRAVVAEVFGDMARWKTLVGCEPQANLSDTCVETYVRAFGRRAFRRDLESAEVEQWVTVARDAAVLAGNATEALSTLTSGFLQSPNFLYRVETNTLDASIDRLKYDGRSMAVRLAFFLTGGPPSAELLAAGESGQLDTAEGVRTAATPLLGDPSLVGRLASFFYEYTQADLMMEAKPSTELFPNFSDSLRNSMKESTRLFLEKVVLAPGADVRSYFDSDQTFADAALAPIYGVTAPSSGFAQVTFTPQSGRAGILGQAGVLTAHSKADHSSPTIRGLFMMQAFFCTLPGTVPGDVDTTLKVDATMTTRQILEAHRANPKCAGCHALFDPMGMALEHFDSIGQYRETENGLPIDASGTLIDGTPFNGAAELGVALRESAPVTECLLRNFYRSVNARDDDLYDQPQVDGMKASLSARGYVFRDLVAEFVVSDAFRSAPRVPITEN